jgi:hypothetical protein
MTGHPKQPTHQPTHTDARAFAPPKKNQDLGWGNLRHMANAAFLVLLGAKTMPPGAERDRLQCWAHGQVQYALGDGGERCSFLVVSWGRGRAALLSGNNNKICPLKQ